MTAGLSTLEIVAWGIITFSILVVLHEGGHFLAARAFGVKVHEFMIGLPGPALRLKTKNMVWGITAIPLGGYVRIAGMEPGAEDELLVPALDAVRSAGTLDAAGLKAHLDAAGTVVEPERADALLYTLADWKAVTDAGDGRCALAVDGDVAGLSARGLYERARSVTYRGIATWKRIVVLGMGVLINMLVALLTFVVVLSVWGYYDMTTRIEDVTAGSPGEKAGLVVGDVIVSVDAEPIADWAAFQAALSTTKPGDEVTIGVQRGEATREVPVTLAEKDGHGFVGLMPTAVFVKPSVVGALGESLRLTGMVFKAIAGFFNPGTFAASVGQSAGVVGISVMAAEAVEAGPLSYAWLIAMLSLSLGAMNILPLPPLDGGKIALELIEGALGRPVHRTVTIALNAAGAVLLFSFIGYVMYADILRLAQ